MLVVARAGKVPEDEDAAAGEDPVEDCVGERPVAMVTEKAVRDFRDSSFSFDR